MGMNCDEKIYGDSIAQVNALCKYLEKFLYDPIEIFSRKEGGNVAGDDLHAAATGFLRPPSHVRREADIFAVKDSCEGVVYVKGLLGVYVYAKSSQAPLLYGTGNCLLVGDGTTCHVNEDGIGLHEGKLPLTDHTTGGVA